MILQPNNISRQILLKYLAEGICQVSFTKVKDNTNRVLLCTLNPVELPAKFLKAVEGIYKPTVDEDLLPVWDVAEGKWKSFRISKINSFRTPDELLENDKEGQDVESSQKVEMEKRKTAAQEKLQNTIARQKEQAQQAKEKLQERAEKTNNTIRNLSDETKA